MRGRITSFTVICVT